MKRLSISVVILALACMAMAVNAHANANDRTYFPMIDPASAAPGVAKAYVLSVENYSQAPPYARLACRCTLSSTYRSQCLLVLH